MITIESANRASAMCTLAAESDYLDMAEACVEEFEKVSELFDGTEGGITVGVAAEH